jgi:hypothetical protein
MKRSSAFLGTGSQRFAKLTYLVDDNAATAMT